MEGRAAREKLEAARAAWAAAYHERERIVLAELAEAEDSHIEEVMGTRPSFDRPYPVPYVEPPARSPARSRSRARKEARRARKAARKAAHEAPLRVGRPRSPPNPPRRRASCSARAQRASPLRARRADSPASGAARS